MSINISIKNRKASFEYSLSNSLVAGIVLLGTEIKSIRNNQANISDAHCIFINQELFVRNLHISEYMQADSHETKRDRKLLLNKQELQKIHAKAKEKGITIIPTRLFINQSGKAKLEISVAKGKKIHDKRQSLKEKQAKREIQKIKKIKNA
tara:strand:+ start:455 stop:907 length:453 start_codon:yes stop_codon:yes gene_type:complete